MHAAVRAVLNGEPVAVNGWRSYWDELAAGTLHGGESVAMMSSLSTAIPSQDTLVSFVESLIERRPPGPPPLSGCVNVVGTGGGPSTFNVSTASALVAAAMGVPVIKTGSRSYASACGSIDLLGQLGIRVTSSMDETLDALDDVGIAFVGTFVYPTELVLLARHVLPIGLREFGRFLNAVGPFLAQVPVSAQVTGIADHRLVEPLRAVAATTQLHDVWLFNNDHGTDELLGFASNIVHPISRHGDYAPLVAIRPGSLTSSAGSLDDLRPVDTAERVDHFRAVLDGRAPAAVIATLALNGAAMAVASRHWTSWQAAVDDAERVVRSGAAADLLDRLRARGARPRARVGATDG
jgi:anthranilate phosphoribosyltransferase